MKVSSETNSETVRQTNRDTVSQDLILGEQAAQRLRSEPDLRILVYCTGVQNPHLHDNLEIAFPAQVEIRINEEAFVGNLRGVKKKPGTTRPADITGLVRKGIPNYVNKLTVTYAATTQVCAECWVSSVSKCTDHSQKYTFVLYLAQKHPVKELVGRIKNRHSISKQHVINQSEWQRPATRPCLVDDKQ